MWLISVLWLFSMAVWTAWIQAALCGPKSDINSTVLHKGREHRKITLRHHIHADITTCWSMKGHLMLICVLEYLHLCGFFFLIILLLFFSQNLIHFTYTTTSKIIETWVASILTVLVQICDGDHKPTILFTMYMFGKSFHHYKVFLHNTKHL